MKTLDSLTPVKTTSLSDAVYEQLRKLIIDQTFLPGQRLNLDEIEEILQVSRTPLKTALKRLELEGLVDIQARKGTFIASVDADQLEENYKIRSSFELYVALCLFKYLNPEDLQRLDEIRDEMNQLVYSSSGNWHAIIDDYIKLDQEFHELIVRVGGPPKMLELFQQLGTHRQLYRVLPQYAPHEFHAMHFEHEQIFIAIEDQSPERLNANLLSHLEAARYRIVHKLK